VAPHVTVRAGEKSSGSETKLQRLWGPRTKTHRADTWYSSRQRRGLCGSGPDDARPFGDAQELPRYRRAPDVMMDSRAAPNPPEEILEPQSDEAVEDGFVGRVD